MELLKLNGLLTNGRGDKLAMILCSQNSCLKKVTYNEVCDITNKTTKFMLSNVRGENICVGLLMEMNVFIPSIILSFQELHYCFVFLTSQTLTKTIGNLNIQWLLSYKDDPLEDNFILEDTLQFSHEDEIKLWRYNDYSQTGKHLSFKDIFCVVQTSGSTGENKIVRVPHSCIENNVLTLNKHFGLTNTDIIYWGTPLTFDPTLVEFLLGLFCQATLLIVPKLVSLNPKLLFEALFKVGQASFLQMVPSVFLRWNKQQIASLLEDSSLKTLAFGGESFPQEILGYERRQELKVFNLYGVTELSCWATISNVTSEYIHMEEVSLGEALDETFIELRNNDEQVILNGVGEIYIGSNSRYCLLNDKEVKMPFMVKTGDLGEFNNSRLVYRGRKTRNIKRFGHKVNLHKIEENILRETNFPSRLVYSVYHKKLLVFILIEEYFNKNTKIRLLDKLRVKLFKIIPETEFPDFIDVVTQFPLNEHGKICDKLLEENYKNSLRNLNREECNPKDMFINILGRYLKTDFNNNIETFRKHTFFQLGGNSILAIQFISEFEEQIGSEIPGELITLMLNESIDSCISYVQNKVIMKRKLSEVHVLSKSKKVIIENNEPYAVVWTYDLKGCVDSSPLIFEKCNSTYVATGSFANIFAILNENGNEYLKLTLPQEVEGKPCISKCGNFIFVGCSNGSMYCIDFSLKIVTWEYHTLGKLIGTACLCRGSSALVLGSYDNCIYCLNIKEGALLWKIKCLGSIRADPLYSESLKTIYVGTTKGMCYALNEEDGTLRWTYKIDGPIFGTPCKLNNYIIWPCVTGILYCLSSMGDLKWTQKITGNIFSSLSVYDNRIYFGCHDSRVYEVTVSDGGSIISNSFNLESEISSTPFVYYFENKLFIVCVCNNGILNVINVSSGSIVFRHKLPAESFSSPYVFKDMIYVGCRDNNLYCIDIKNAVIN